MAIAPSTYDSLVRLFKIRNSKSAITSGSCASSKSAIHNSKSAITSGPFQRAFAPRVIQTYNQNPDEDKHLDQRKLGKRKIIAHKDDCPGQQKDRLDVENQE